MNKFFEELKRRNVIKASIAYVVVAWVLLQVLSIVLPSVDAPQWVMKTIMLIMVIAFPVWVFIAWVYEVTPEGLKKTEEVDKDQSITHTTNKRLNILILIGLIAAIAVTLLQPKTGYISSSDFAEHSIAVLPFDDMSAEKDTEWFCDGVTEDILTYLSKIKGLKVVSRTSTERYKKTDKSIPEIAKELGVAFILEGSVRRHNEAVLITAQLIKANDEHIWADNFNGNMEDVFKIQGDVSRKIVEQLKIKISPEVEKQLKNTPTENIEAYQAFLKGRNLAKTFSDDDLQKSIDYFKEAIALDPNYADAYAELGLAYLSGNTNERNPSKAKEYMEKALELDPNSSAANSNYGIYLCAVDQNFKEGKTYLEKAIQLNPNDSKAHSMMAYYYSFVQDDKDVSKALYHSNKAVELEPFSPESISIRANLLVANNKLDLAESFMEEKKSLIPPEQLKFLKRDIVSKRIELNIEENKDQTVTFKGYEAAITKYPDDAAYFTQALAGAYDGILNDQTNYLKYAKRAYEMDSSKAVVISQYQAALLESGLFDEANILHHSENYKKVISKRDQLIDLVNYYYFTKDKENLNIMLQDSVIATQNSLRAYSYAQLGDMKKLYTVMDKLNSANKVQVFAILKRRDSLYFYLNKDDISESRAQYINSRPEMDPYRTDPRYIEFLKRHYFPINEQKN